MDALEAQAGTDAPLVRQALVALRQGDPDGLDALFTALYPELRALAHRQMAGEGATLGTTGLVHELYLKFSRARFLEARDHAHFLAVASRAMRQILVDQARRRLSSKRLPPDPITGLAAVPPEHHEAEELLALDRALARLEERDPRAGRMVELRYFGGLSVEETATVLSVSSRTVKRDWRVARAFLHDALNRRAG
jgi:RNA polymerase sigma factor (TIGR02999 family)